MAFLGIPITANPSIVKELLNDVLKPLELKLMKDGLTHFPTFCHGRSDWVKYSVTKYMSFGMPFEKYDDNTEWKPNGRLSFVFQVADQDVTRLFSLLIIAKEKNLWKVVCLAKCHSQCR